METQPTHPSTVASPSPGAKPDSPFPSTHWTTVLMAGENGSTQAHDALGRLCGKYWYPLYVYVRRRGYSHAEGQDLTQEFFSRLLEGNLVRLAKRERGKFRSFLLSSLNNFLINEWKKERAQKRGGGRVTFFSELEGADERWRLDAALRTEPEEAFDESWALAVLRQAFARLHAEWTGQGREDLFQKLKPFLLGDADGPYREVARHVGVSEGAIKVGVHRLRRRLRELLNEEIRHTVADPSEIHDETRHFIRVLERSAHLDKAG